MSLRVVHPKRVRSAGFTPAGFTLVELLVTITVIGMLAAMALGGLASARQTARETKTKALITKLNAVIMAKYESYQTRRVPVLTYGMNPDQAARVKLNALRDLMRMEMPERYNDVDLDPIANIQRPPISWVYKQRLDTARASHDPTTVGENGPAELLYMIVTTGSPDDREQFNQGEIGDVDHDGLPEFLDGWGQPIMFLRWAPGFEDSDFQTGDPVEDHDPFDPRNVELNAFRMVPLIYSGGSDKKPGIELVGDYQYSGNPYENMAIGGPDPRDPKSHLGNIHNHHIEAR